MMNDAKTVDEDDSETITLKVFNCPRELANKYISYAKLYKDNEMWKVLKEGIELLTEEKKSTEKKVEELSKKVDRLEEYVASLDRLIQPEEEDELQTFGS